MIYGGFLFKKLVCSQRYLVCFSPKASAEHTFTLPVTPQKLAVVTLPRALLLITLVCVLHHLLFINRRFRCRQPLTKPVAAFLDIGTFSCLHGPCSWPSHSSPQLKLWLVNCLVVEPDNMTALRLSAFLISQWSMLWEPCPLFSQLSLCMKLCLETERVSWSADSTLGVQGMGGGWMGCTASNAISVQ